MRIGYDAKRAFNNHRGLGNYSRDTIRIVASHFPDLQMDLFTPKTDSSIRFDCPKNATIIQPKHDFMTSLWRTFGITKEAERRHLDLYHGLSHELPVGIEKTRIPTVLTMHDLIFIRHPELYPFIDRKLYKTKYLRSCRVADRIIAVSQRFAPARFPRVSGFPVRISSFMRSSKLSEKTCGSSSEASRASISASITSP